MCQQVYVDYRVCILGKSLTLNTNGYADKDRTNQDEKTGRLIALGYFDFLEIEPLNKAENVTWLTAAWQKSVALSMELSDELYRHPLYVMSYGDAAWEKEIYAFWRQPARFVFLTFMHWTPAAMQSGDPPAQEEAFSQINQLINDLTKNNPSVHAVCYRSIDLSDTVVIWKSDSMVALLQSLHALYRSQNIGDLHTICAFPYSSIKDTCTEEIIPYVSLRFSTRDAEKTSEFFHVLKERLKKDWPDWPPQPCCFTTGTEDLDIHFSDLPLSKFLLLLRVWFTDDDLNRLFELAFYDCGTHLGILDIGDNPQPGGSKAVLGTSSELSTLCTSMLDDFQKFRRELHIADEAQIDYSWLKSVSVQLHALTNMSRQCILDGFCYLILDAVQAFCHQIKPLLIQNNRLGPVQLGSAQRFIRGWGVLMEQAVKADGQFTHNPGFSPVLYDIPVSLLEFYIAFTNQCMSYLQRDEKNPKHFALFLLPKLCRRVKVENVFQALPPTDRLLYVDVPLDLLYTPKKILFQLCHEVSHYCGEKQRLRESRCDHFLITCAQLIAWYLDLGHLSVIYRIYDDLCEGMNIESMQYMNVLETSVRERVMHLLRDGNVFSFWKKSYLKEMPFKSFEEEKACSLEIEDNYRMLMFYLKLNDFGDDITRIRRLYEECYADISMVFLLRPTRNEYLELYSQELEWLDTSFNQQRNELVQRAALVDSAVGEWPTDGGNEDFSDKLRKFSQDVSKLKEDLLGGGPDRINFFPFDLLATISDYLATCYRKMSEQNGAAEQLRHIRETMQEVSNGCNIGNECFQRTLKQYETRCLNALREEYACAPQENV